MAGGIDGIGLESGSAASAAVRIARRHLGDARRAARKLAGDRDGEALHDFRVALRRLRAHLKAYRDVLQPASSRKMLRNLKKIARRTSSGRDYEVWLEWLRKERSSLAPRMDVDTLIREFELLKDLGYQEVRDHALGRFAHFEPKLKKRLKKARNRADAKLKTPEIVSKIVAREASKFRKLLKAYDAHAGAAAAHRLRVEEKRLRYLLEPWSRSDALRAIVRRLKDLQDGLGRLHDLQGLAAQKEAKPILAEIVKSERNVQKELGKSKLAALERSLAGGFAAERNFRSNP